MLGCSHASFESISHMLQILQGFDDSTVQLSDGVWDDLALQVTGKQQEQLREFQCKNRFLQENKFLQVFPIDSQDIKIVYNLPSSKRDLYRMWLTCWEWVIFQQNPKAFLQIQDTVKGAWKYRSDTLLMHQLKKALPFCQKQATALISFSQRNERTEDAKKQDRLALECIKKDQDQIYNVSDFYNQFAKKPPLSKKKEDKELRNLHAVMNKFEKIFNETNSAKEERSCVEQFEKQLQEQVVSRAGVNFVKGVFQNAKNSMNLFQQTLKRRIHVDKLCSLKGQFSLINFFMNYISDLMLVEQIQKKTRKRMLIYRSV